MKYKKEVDTFMYEVIQKNPNESIFHQAVFEVAESIIPFIMENPKYQGKKILERLSEPERVIIFKVGWKDDKGEVQVNRGFRIEMNSNLGPYKGGLRFHSSVSLDSLKFLAFEQVLKNSLTTLNLGGGKGGSDFSPVGKSDDEIMRFCYAFMSELYRYIGPDTDIPAGDIGVGGREIGYLFGQYKKLKNQFVGVLTGKGIEWGGSILRPEATGFGVVYFAKQMLETKGLSLEGKRVAVSGFGNVSWGAVTKANEMGAKVVTISGPDGYIYDPDGISGEKIDYMLEMRMSNTDKVKDYANKFGVQFIPNKKPWEVEADIALPCAIQNEINLDDAKNIIHNNYICITEGANMPCTTEAVHAFQNAKLLYSPGKASNAGGVAISGIEMVQNAIHFRFAKEEIDQRLQSIMESIHSNCIKYGRNEDGYIDYMKGANIAGFVKVANAMIEQGIV
ncbi:MAG: NADP-specific glutamate dehydrogenase [Bacteroidales bacterium]|nr:NADP-specific glutamate dehydrogenase [Bacteroidales bacterium]